MRFKDLIMIMRSGSIYWGHVLNRVFPTYGHLRLGGADDLKAELFFRCACIRPLSDPCSGQSITV
jgi:hypothetical protein